MSMYTAASLEDVAEMFDRFAKSAVEQAGTRQSQRAKQFELGRASAWQEAANMLRKTTIAESSK